MVRNQPISDADEVGDCSLGHYLAADAMEGLWLHVVNMVSVVGERER